MSFVDVVGILNTELARARASETSTANALAHSLRDATGKAQQQRTADSAKARAVDLAAAVVSIEIFLEDVDSVIRDLPAGSIRRRLASARSRIGAPK